MITGQQLWIFKNIGSMSYSREEKLDAIKAVVKHDSFNNVFKEDMWNVIRWLVALREEEQRDETNNTNEGNKA